MGWFWEIKLIKKPLTQKEIGVPLSVNNHD